MIGRTRNSRTSSIALLQHVFGQVDVLELLQRVVGVGVEPSEVPQGGPDDAPELEVGEERDQLVSEGVVLGEEAATVPHQHDGSPDRQQLVLEIQCVEQLQRLHVVGVEVLGAHVDACALSLEQLNPSTRDRARVRRSPHRGRLPGGSGRRSVRRSRLRRLRSFDEPAWAPYISDPAPGLPISSLPGWGYTRSRRPGRGRKGVAR